MTVGRMKREMSSMEFLRWSIYYQLRHQDQELAAAKASIRRG